MLRIKSSTASSADTSKEQTYVPLKQVSINATIHSFAADVTITQIFRNDETQSIEAVYCFPIEEQAAIYSFTAHIDDREIHAELKEKVQAQQEYNNALQEGHGAYLLEQDEKSQDNFIINIGSLLPSKECRITISYVSELDFVQGSIIRFVIPTTIAPRYNPSEGAITAPTNTNSKYVQSTPYKIDFNCCIEKLNRSEDDYISQINSPSHPIQINFSQQNVYQISFAQENTHLDRDIILNIELSDKRTNTITAVESDAIMGVFIPRKEDCYQGLDNNNNNRINEFIFVVDCSGSMKDENKIGLARQAMILFLKSLPLNCHFNIIRFGSEYKSLFNDITVIYNEENAEAAQKHINEMNADLGGTKLIKPLEWLKQHSPSEGRARQIFLLTDGEISNVTEVIDLCRSMALSTRIFSFGLGASPSRSLVKGLARSTNGRFVFIPPNSNVDIYVGEQLQKALQPSITNIHVQWKLGVDVQNVPTQPPPVYLNDRLIVYALKQDKTIPFDHNSSVELQTEPDHRLLSVAKIDSIPKVTDNQTITRLAAKALILELQHIKLQSSNTGSIQSRFKDLMVSDEKTIKERIIALSLKYNILSPHTAFIGIEKRMNGSNADMVLREVPIEICNDDQHLLTSSRSVFSHQASTTNSNTQTRYAELQAKRASLETMRRQKPSARSSKISHTNSNNYNQESSVGFDICCSVLESAISDVFTDRLRALRECNDPPSKSTPVSMCDEDSELSKIESKDVNISGKDNILPSNDQDIVRYLIKKQKFDGLWNLDSDIIKQLTGKSFLEFQSQCPDIDSELINSIIVILLIETRFPSLSSLWYGIVQKARNRVIELLGKDSNKMDKLFVDIRNQL